MEGLLIYNRCIGYYFYLLEGITMFHFIGFHFIVYKIISSFVTLTLPNMHVCCALSLVCV